MRKNFYAVIMLLFCSVMAGAQGTTGRLSGTVSGPDGALPGATVVATDNNTGKQATVITNDSGSFLFPQLEFGTYTVKISASGFKAFVANEVKIDVGREYTLDPILQIGDVQESVTVTAGADVVTSTTAQITNTVSPQQIVSLPLVTRNPLTLTQLQAGAAPAAASPFQVTSINGMRTTLTNITRDGINIQDAFIRNNATDFAPARPSVDDTGEDDSDSSFGGYYSKN